MRPKQFFAILILSLILLPVTPVLAEEMTADDIADQLMCQCDCGMVLSNCTHATCPSAPVMIAVIEQRLAQSESQEEILDYFVAQYGEQVLTSPPKKGFNLVLWILTPAAILVGGVVIYLTVKAWEERGRQSPSTTGGAKEGDEEYQERLEKELDEFSEGGFR